MKVKVKQNLSDLTGECELMNDLKVGQGDAGLAGSSQ